MFNYRAHHNVDQESALTLFHYFAEGFHLSVGCLDVFIAVDQQDSTLIFLDAGGRNLLVADRLEQDMPSSMSSSGRWVMRVRHPAAFLDSVTVRSKVAHDSITVHHVVDHRGEDLVYVTDHRCALVACDPKGPTVLTEDSTFTAIEDGVIQVRHPLRYDAPLALRPSTETEDTGCAELDRLLRALN